MTKQIRHLLLFVILSTIVLTQGHVSLGLTGTVGPTDSIIGSHANDNIGSGGVTLLPNGNIVIASPNWNGGMGAVTCVTPAQYKAGNIIVSPANSLVGSSAGDQVGSSVIDYTSGVTVLSNGNYVVDSRNWNGSRGAITWAKSDCSTVGVVSASNSLVGIIGGSSGDRVGYNGVAALSDGNYVVMSPFWNNNSGAVTWANGTAVVAGTVSVGNSLVGSNAGDQVGTLAYSYPGVTALSNGNYVVASPFWNSNSGAVTWANGTTGVTGTVSVSNSLVGTIGGSSGDRVGYNGVTALNNGNYVVMSPTWNGSDGASTWANGATGMTGTVSVSNSLVGSNAGDQAGMSATALKNGNYVVQSFYWNGGMGAATWGNGLTGITGLISASNSLIGNLGGYFGDHVGINIAVLPNGNYVICSPSWNNRMGAATWESGTTSLSGIISASNSLIGSNPNDSISGNCTITVLTNGNYLVNSYYWHGNIGAVTWGNGSTGITGVVSVSNSLIGSNSGDYIGSSVIALKNGNYVIASGVWNFDTGAVTWGNGTAGTTGVVSASNSLVGSTYGDYVGSDGVTPLSNGNYVANSSRWNNFRGAVTLGNGATGLVGTVSASNSLVGSVGTNSLNCVPADCVGSDGVIALTNGNYVVASSEWNNGVGAATWGNGTAGTTGVVSTSNSLVGGTANDFVSQKYYPSGGVTALTNGNYVVSSYNWNGKQGAATWGNGTTGSFGTISALNSLIGSAAGDQVGIGTYGIVNAITPLSNGDYLVISPNWSNGTATGVGAVTYSDGLPVTPRLDTIGIYRGGTFYLRLHNSTGNADLTVGFTAGTKPYPIVGDWTGAGFDAVGIFDQSNGKFTLCTANVTASCANVANQKSLVLGIPNDQPLSGRWLINAANAGVGVFRPSNGLIYLKNALTTGYADYTMVLGIPGDVGVAGDWNGKGFDSPGVYRPSNSFFYLSNQVKNGSVIGDYQMQYGVGGDAPIVGDWIAQRHDGIGLFRQSNGFTYLKNALTTGYADNTFTYGIAGDIPVAGHWQAVYPPIAPPSVLIAKTAIPSQPNGSIPGDNPLGD